MDDDLFSPCDTDDVTGARISAKSLGSWGDESVIEPAWEALERARTAEEFYRAAAALVFHARHLCPVEHARLAKMLRFPFKLKRGGQLQWERTEEIIFALQSSGSLFSHGWGNMSREQVIDAIIARWGMNEEAARKAYDKARGIMREREAARTKQQS